MITFSIQVLLPQAVRARRHPGSSAWWKGGLLTPAFWVGGSNNLAGLARFSAHVCRRLLAETSDTLQEVQGKNKQLRVQLSKTPWPILKSFSANRQTYNLPLRAESGDLPSEPVLAYLAGFFDGDGCVSCASNLSGPVLQVSQAFDQAEVLMRLGKTFGGSIAREHGGMGLRKPKLQWRAYGQSARNAAQLLAPQSITKQKQLLLAAEWPDARSRREECQAELRALKECDSAVARPCSWEYCAGFFDAEGYIRQLNGGASLTLEVTQKHPQVLKSLREFLAEASSIEARVGKLPQHRHAHALRVGGLSDCKLVLQHLLAAGLLCKAEQAKLVLDLTPETAAQVHTELGPLTGNQMFGHRLDAAGLERARKIKCAQARAARFRQGRADGRSCSHAGRG